MLELLAVEDRAMPGGASAKGRRFARKPGPAKARAAKVQRKVQRTRR